MGEWERRTLGGVCTITKGTQINRTALADEGDYYVLNGGMEPSGYHDNYNTGANTISISEGGNSCGYIAFNTEPFWSGGHNYTLSGLALEQHYLYHYLKYSEPKIMGLRVGTGLPNIQRKRLEAFPVVFPSDTAEQSRIAAVLTSADEAITASRALVEKYAAIKQGLMRDLLMNGLDRSGNIRNLQTSTYKESELGMIPTDWDCVTIDSITSKVGSGATPRGGEDVYVKEGILFIRSQNVTFDGLLLDDVAYIDKSTNASMRRSQVEHGDILLNITGASIGRCCVFDLTAPANVNQHVCIIRTTSGEDYAKFVSYWLSSFGQRQIYALFAGSNREGLNFSQIKSIKLPVVPNDKELRGIISVLESANDRLTAERERLRKLENIKRGLMDDLLTNRVSTDKLQGGV